MLRDAMNGRPWLMLTAAFLLTAGCNSSGHHGHDHAPGDGHDHSAGDGHDHSAGDAHDHHGHDDPARPPGPNGGRVIAGFQPPLELLVTDERRVRITFLGETGEPMPAAGQVVTVVAGDRANPTRLSFARDGASLLSSGPLPQGGLMPVIVSVAQGDGASPVRERFNLNLATCPVCSRPEYACTCGS